MTEIRKLKPQPEMMTQEEPAVEAYIEQLEEKNNHLLDKIQSFYKNEKLDLIERGRFLRELNDKIDENAECRMAVTADELLEFIEEFEPVTEGELVARLSELEEENARLEESFQRATGEITADPLYGECTNKAEAADDFICSHCGIHISDFAEEEIEEYDDGYEDVVHHLYEPKFCPECGRKVVDDGGADND